MRTDGNLGGTLTFNPNSAGLWDNQPDFTEPAMPIEGDAAHWDHRVDDDHWEQPGNLFRKRTPAQQQLLFENTARAMGDAKLHIKQRHVENCTRADPAYGAGVARALGITVGDLASRQQRTAAEEPSLHWRGGRGDPPALRPTGDPPGNARRPFQPTHRSAARL